MNLDSIVKELTVERQRIDAALTALVGYAAKPTVIAPHTFTHAQHKMTAKAKKDRTQSKKSHRSLSPAVREKIAASQRARWAKVTSTKATANAAIVASGDGVAAAA